MTTLLHKIFKISRDLYWISESQWYIDESEKLANEILQKLKENVRDIPEVMQLQILMMEEDLNDNLANLQVRLSDIITYHW